MSLLKNLIEAVISIFISNFPRWIEKSFNKIPNEVVKEIESVIKLVDAWKDNPAIDAITALIPGHWDDDLVEFVRDLLMFYEASSAEDKHVASSKIVQQITGTSFGQAAITTEVVWQKLNKLK